MHCSLDGLLLIVDEVELPLGAHLGLFPAEIRQDDRLHHILEELLDQETQRVSRLLEVRKGVGLEEIHSVVFVEKKIEPVDFEGVSQRLKDRHFAMEAREDLRDDGLDLLEDLRSQGLGHAFEREELLHQIILFERRVGLRARVGDMTKTIVRRTLTVVGERSEQRQDTIVDMDAKVALGHHVDPKVEFSIAVGGQQLGIVDVPLDDPFAYVSDGLVVVLVGVLVVVLAGEEVF